MKTILAFLFALVGVSSAAISTATKPHTIDSAATPKVSYVDDNDEALLDKINEIIDTTNLHNSSGSVVGSVFSSTGDMRLLVDSDNNGTNRWSITSGGATDTLWRILEGGTWKAFGDGTGTKLTLSDSILAATARISGNGTFGGTLGVTGASTIAALSATTGTFSGTLGVTGASTLAALSATTGSFSSTLGVTGTTTLGSTVIIGAGIQMENQQAINMKNTSGTLRSVLNVNASNNLAIGGTVDGGINFYTNLGNNAGVVSSAGAWALPSTLGVTGNLTLSTLSSGRIPVVSTAGLITQDNLYWDATNDRLGIGNSASSPAVDIDVVSSNVGASTAIRISNPDNTNAASNARLIVLSGGASGGDAYSQYTISGITNWLTGIDNSDADAFVISESSTLGSSNRLRIASGGAVTIPGTLGVTGAITGSNLSGTNTGDQTNISGNAATVTTNANLTGPITSTGNATAIASQTGTGTTFMMSASPTTTGTLTAAAITASGAVSTGALTATTATLGGGEAFTYGDTSFTVTLTGVSGSVTGTARATKIGKLVTLSIPVLQGTSNTTAMTITGIPSSLYVASGHSVMQVLVGFDNGVQGDLWCHQIDGTVTCSTDAAGSGFVSSGSKGLGYSFTVSYITD